MMLRATAIVLGLLAAPAAAQSGAVTLILGAKDNVPSTWNGSATISAGEIVRIQGYHFTAKDRIDGAAWQCATHPWPTNQGGMHPNEQPQPHQTMVVPIGVTIEYRAPTDASIRVRLESREEFSFRPSDIPENGALFPLRGMIEVWRTPVVERLSGAEAQDDHPAIAVDGDTVWVSWMAYRDKADEVMLRARRAGQWETPAAVSDKAGDYFGTAVAASGGKAMVVWSDHEGETWQLRYHIHDGSRLGPVGSITSGQSKNLFHRIAAGPGGSFHVVYQSWRGSRAALFPGATSATSTLPAWRRTRKAASGCSLVRGPRPPYRIRFGPRAASGKSRRAITPAKAGPISS